MYVSKFLCFFWGGGSENVLCIWIITRTGKLDRKLQSSQFYNWKEDKIIMIKRSSGVEVVKWSIRHHAKL